MHIYFSGIGGTAIGPLAMIAKQAGHDVSGSDKQDSQYIHYLQDHGIENVHVGQTREQIASKAGEWKDKAAEIKDQAVDKASQWKEAASTKIQEMTGRASDTMQAAKNGVEKVGSTANDEMANVGETARG